MTEYRIRIHRTYGAKAKSKNEAILAAQLKMLADYDQYIIYQECIGCEEFVLSATTSDGMCPDCAGETP